eukprot:scaffold910_cov396-Prasinococcus_capsulatus_cf.AAC.6
MKIMFLWCEILLRPGSSSRILPSFRTEGGGLRSVTAHAACGRHESRDDWTASCVWPGMWVRQGTAPPQRGSRHGASAPPAAFRRVPLGSYRLAGALASSLIGEATGSLRCRRAESPPASVGWEGQATRRPRDAANAAAMFK